MNIVKVFVSKQFQGDLAMSFQDVYSVGVVGAAQSIITRLRMKD